MRMSQIDRVNEESKQFAKEWRGQLFRSFLAILASAILLVVFSPSNLLEYVASFIVLVTLFLWAYKRPENVKYRAIVTGLCLLTATGLYLGVINGS